MTTDPARVQANLRLLGPAPPNWLPERPELDHDIAVVGAGQAGVALAHALRRAGLSRFTLIEAAAEGDEGIWRHRAHMPRLRTPKTLLGPDFGIPDLTFEAWYAAQHGAAAHEALPGIPREAWADYLTWLRLVLEVQPRWSTRLERVEPEGDHLKLHLSTPEGARVERVRKLILATGIASGGADAIPEVLSAIPPSRIHHAGARLGARDFRGQRVGVLGAAASGFDVAALALEGGAAEVHLFVRRDHVPASTQLKAARFAGFDGYRTLPPELRWEWLHRVRRSGSAPAHSVARATRHPNFFLHLSAPVTRATFDGQEIALQAGGRGFALDQLLIGTGYAPDARRRPEFSGFGAQIATWGDRFTPPPGLEDQALSAYPWLGEGLELTELHPGRAPFLRHIHLFTPEAQLQAGSLVGDVGSLRRQVPRLVESLVARFLAEDLEHHRAQMLGPVDSDFGPELWQEAAERGRAFTPAREETPAE